MEQDRLDELTEARFRHLDRFTSAMFESQQEMMRLTAENTKALAQLVARTDSMEKRIDSMEKRMDGMEKRMDSMEKRMDSMEKRMETMEGLQTLALDDLAFIKEYLQRRQ